VDPATTPTGQCERAWVAELTGILNESGSPKGMRVITRKEGPHTGAQLRITDADGAVGHRHRRQQCR